MTHTSFASEQAQCAKHVPDVAHAHNRLSSSAISSPSRENGSNPVTSVLAFLPCRALTTTEIGFNCPFLSTTPREQCVHDQRRSVLQYRIFPLCLYPVPALHLLG